MATARSQNFNSASAEVVHQLADLLRKNGHRARSGDSKVCFTSESLTLLNNYFQAAKLSIAMPAVNGHSLTNSMVSLPQLPIVPNLRVTNKLKEDLVFLRDFLQKIESVKLIHNAPTLQGNVFLYPFQAVTCLELKRISPHMVLGLSQLRNRLQTLICSQSQSITEIGILIRNGDGYEAQSQEWPNLKSLFLSHNMIERIDDSLKCFIALEILDLSHNRLKDCSRILEYIPHIRRLNLSSNNIRTVPMWSPSKGSCPLLTLKMRQNTIENLDGIENLAKLEELDLTDNFITVIPKQIRQLSKIKRLYFSRNPFTYDSNYRRALITYLPYYVPDEQRELTIDDQPLTLKEKQKIPRTSYSQQSLVPNYIGTSPSISTVTTPPTSSDSTESESMTAGSSGTIVTRRRSRRKVRDPRIRTLDGDVSSTVHNSELETTMNRDRLEKVTESAQEDDQNYSRAGFTFNYPSATIDQDELYLSKPFPSIPATSSVQRKLNNDLSESPKRRQSPHLRAKGDPPTRLVLEVVDKPIMSDSSESATSGPSSPVLDKNFALGNNLVQDNPIINAEQITGDDIRTLFFVANQTSSDERDRKLFTVEIDRMYLIEKDNDDETYVEKIKYSTIKLLPNDNPTSKTVTFTFEKRRDDVATRVYVFDTIHDRMAFVDEIKRHIEVTTPVEEEPAEPLFVQCTTCGKTFQVATTMNNGEHSIPSICLSCQTISLLPKPELEDEVQLKPDVDVFSDEYELDHRLHLLLAADHFTDNQEEIKLKFKCFAVCSTTNKHFICQTVLTDFGIYIFEQESVNDEETQEFVLVGKDLLSKVLLLDIGYRLQTFTIELQSAAFTFLLADQQKTQKIANHILEVLLPIVQSGDGALQKISRISSDQYRQRLFDIIKTECDIDEPNDDMIDFYSIMIRMDQNGNNQMIALLLLRNWILMIEDAYAIIDSRHVRLPAQSKSGSQSNQQQLKCDLMHLVNVTNYLINPKLLVFDFVDESETVQFEWKLESITNDSKTEFLKKTRDTYKKIMGVVMPEKLEMA